MGGRFLLPRKRKSKNLAKIIGVIGVGLLGISVLGGAGAKPVFEQQAPSTDLSGLNQFLNNLQSQISGLSQSGTGTTFIIQPSTQDTSSIFSSGGGGGFISTPSNAISNAGTNLSSIVKDVTFGIKSTREQRTGLSSFVLDVTAGNLKPSLEKFRI